VELIGSIPFFGGAFSALIAFVIALSVIVAIHEYGHYIVGRWCGIHAEVFSLGFGKTLVSWHDKRGTKWQIAAIPFGGYVRFLGDADASSRNDPDAIAAMDETTRSRSFHGAALYKKALTVVAGPVANFILTFLVFMGLVWFTGIAVEPPTIGSLKSLPDSVKVDQRHAD
jgi:regulator of sigma E protease